MKPDIRGYKVLLGVEQLARRPGRGWRGVQLLHGVPDPALRDGGVHLEDTVPRLPRLHRGAGGDIGVYLPFAAKIIFL